VGIREQAGGAGGAGGFEAVEQNNKQHTLPSP